ncbi:hypothetical protein [Scleromatobacter humisilvae]|uniref:Antitoxin Xre/MbcA/ParS-like toxin-binding domain-containing protein n=1 Tax=Scleromatobacter humisilvae TaxID=2897159 RepID=A0A9X1YMT8_9BURK|nr:hypothetical protein [Scleromatobacter humisilvae]MCK9689469.1 hypothetical protein [Scleromatobacter humisilvae]
MSLVYTKAGGLCTCDEVLDLLRQRFDQPISMLAKWIVGRSVVNMHWRSRTLIPLFQFDLRDMCVRSEVVAVIAELTSAYDDFEIAHWFAEPNGWLAGTRPVEILRQSPEEVLEAARADRYVARG